MENRIPTRDINDYKGLTRSIAQNHYRVEDKKVKEHRSTNMLQMFLNSKWILWLYHYIKSRFGSRHKFQTYEGHADKGIYKFDSANNSAAVKIALAADWGTDTVESKQVGLAIAKHDPDYTIHLGDTYYVGASAEIENNFKPGDSFWPYGSVGSFALTGNHEMYSNGDPYYDILLKYMGLYKPGRVEQKASYFCLENDYWRIIGLDTGYRSVGIPFLEILFSNADLRPEVIKWLKNDVRIKDDNRAIIFLTHHQYFSAFENDYPKAATQLEKIIGKDRKALWFWGHEHRFAIYGKHSVSNGITAYGRCIGHGGMPASLFNEQRKKLKPRNLVIYDNRTRSQLGRVDVGHNGYCLLNIENENLVAEYYDEKTLLITEKWRFDKNSGDLEGIKIESFEQKLSQKKEIGLAIQ